VVGDAHEPDPLLLAEDAAVPSKGVLARPDLGTQLEIVEAELFGELSPERLLNVLTFVTTAARGCPPDLIARVAELDQ
jgi:hypothetical protein